MDKKEGDKLPYNVQMKKFGNNEVQIKFFDNPIIVKNEDGFCNLSKSNRIELTEDEKKIKSKNTSLSRTKNKVIDYARSNDWDWFVTLTFDKEKVDRYDYDKVSQKLINWLKIVRRNNKGVKYIVVPEMHRDGAFHFHGLLTNCNNVDATIAYNKDGTVKKDKHGRTVYNLGKYRLGWSTATKVTSSKKASNYITKYITKDLFVLTKGRKRYWNSRNLNLPKIEKLWVANKVDFLQQKEIIETISNYKKEIVVDSPDYKNNICIFEINNSI